MTSSHFETFIAAFSALSEELRTLAGDFIICPPIDDFGYRSTPQNALTFVQMGVDGVHHAILKINGSIRDESPVVYVSPMDSDDVIVLAGSFLEYLADGCDVSTGEMLSVLNAERLGGNQLVSFLQERFHVSRLLDERRIHSLQANFEYLIERK